MTRPDTRSLAERVAARVGVSTAVRAIPGRLPSRPPPTQPAPLMQNTLPVPLRQDTLPAPLAPATLPGPLAPATLPGPIGPAGGLAQARCGSPKTLGWRTARPGEAVMLMPGELYFGGEAASVKTLLGSCVALTLWHSRRRLGGMCHYLLPTRQRAPGVQRDGRFGDEAVDTLVEMLERHGCRSSEFTAHLYGGADMMAEHFGVKLNIGERNIERGWSLVDQHGFALDGVDVGDNVPRTVTLELANGSVECRRGKPG